MRRGEACALRWSDVDEEHSSVRINESVVVAAGGAEVKGQRREQASVVRRSTRRLPRSCDACARCKRTWLESVTRPSVQRPSCSPSFRRSHAAAPGRNEQSVHSFAREGWRRPRRAPSLVAALSRHRSRQRDLGASEAGQARMVDGSDGAALHDAITARTSEPLNTWVGSWRTLSEAGVQIDHRRSGLRSMPCD